MQTNVLSFWNEDERKCFVLLICALLQVLVCINNRFKLVRRYSLAAKNWTELLFHDFQPKKLPDFKRSRQQLIKKCANCNFLLDEYCHLPFMERLRLAGKMFLQVCSWFYLQLPKFWKKHRKLPTMTSTEDDGTF